LNTSFCLLLLLTGSEPAVPAGRVQLLRTLAVAAGETASSAGYVPGQRRIGSEGALVLLVVVLATALTGGALLRRTGIAAHDDAIRTRPLTCALTGGAVLATAVCLVANGRVLGRFQLGVEAIACLALAASVLMGFAGVASVVGRAVARGIGRRVAPGWRSLAIGALVVAGLCLLPLAGAAIALAAVMLASGAAFVRPR